MQGSSIHHVANVSNGVSQYLLPELVRTRLKICFEHPVVLDHGVPFGFHILHSTLRTENVTDRFEVRLKGRFQLQRQLCLNLPLLDSGDSEAPKFWVSRFGNQTFLHRRWDKGLRLQKLLVFLHKFHAFDTITSHDRNAPFSIGNPGILVALHLATRTGKEYLVMDEVAHIVKK
ncbi:hypothetical protein CQ012_10570 [Arthrobacter sp. MYb214]|nr:hypothetical protein CQ012_10570 [Arthrobacter sp. MYb214]